MRRLDVPRRVADDIGRSRLSAEDRRGALDSDPGELTAVRRVRAVAAEGEEAVEACPGDLDVRRRLDVARRQAQEVA